jgi:hypothetical protein
VAGVLQWRPHLGRGPLGRVGRVELLAQRRRLLAGEPAELPGRRRAGGITAIPVQLTVDEQGRVREVTDIIKLASVTTTAKSTLTDFDQPVSIQAPPASQVGTS